jgi:hypothetical protein
VFNRSEEESRRVKHRERCLPGIRASGYAFVEWNLAGNEFLEGSQIIAPTGVESGGDFFLRHADAFDSKVDRHPVDFEHFGQDDSRFRVRE